jgi:hypothetical protein
VLSAVVALGIPAAVYLGGDASDPTNAHVGLLSATILLGVLAAVGAIVQTRRARPASALSATALFVLAVGFAVFQVPALAIADAAAGACCLFFIIGRQLPAGQREDRAGAVARILDEFRPALVGACVATPGLVIGTMMSAQPSVLIEMLAGLLVVAAMVGLARRMI